MATDPSALITAAQAYATTALANASSALNSAMSVAERIGQGYIGGTDGVSLVINPPTPFEPGPVPSYEGVRFDPEFFSDKLEDLEEVDGLDMPKPLGTRPDIPDIDIPDEPTTKVVKNIGNAPIIKETFKEPEAPETKVDSITKPTFTPVVFPTGPVKYIEPEFRGVQPSAPPAAPTDLDVVLKDQYSTISPIMLDVINQQFDSYLDQYFPEFRTAMAQIEERLATYLEGGSALSPAIENAIYNRTLDKTNADARRASDEAWGKAARAGFTIPPATLLAQLQDVDQARRDNNARAATEIAIKQAELEQNNLQFAVTQSANLRKVAIDSALAYYSGLVQVNGQALEYARSVVDTISKIYELATKYSELQVRIYESEINVYEAKVKGAMAVIDGFKAEVDAATAQVNGQKTEVDFYIAQLEGIKTEYELYTNQVEALKALMGVEKLKIDLYATKVDAYKTEVDAFAAEWQGFEAAVKGKTAVVQAKALEVDAFTAEIKAYESEIYAKGKIIDTQLAINKQKLDQFSQKIEQFYSQEKMKIQATELEITNHQVELKDYEAFATAQAEKSKAEITMYQVAQQALSEAARIQYMYTENMNRTEVAKANAIGEVAGRIGDVYGRVAQATMSGMNSLAASTTTKKE